MIKKFKKLQVSQLRKAKWNYKTEDKRLLRSLVENIRRNGQIENLIVRDVGKDEYEVVNGNHRLDALLEIGEKEVTCFNLGTISESEAKRVAVETNETKFEADPVMLATLMAELAGEYGSDDLAKTMPYSPADISRLVQLTSFNWTEFGAGEALATQPPEVPDGIDQSVVDELLRDQTIAGALEDDMPTEFTLTVHGFQTEELEEVRAAFRETGKDTDAEALVKLCKNYVAGLGKENKDDE